MVKCLIEKEVLSQVIWVDPYPTRLPGVSDLRRFGQRTDRLPPPFKLRNLSVLAPFALPIEPLPGGTWINHMACWRGMKHRLLEYAVRHRGSLVVGIGRPHALAKWGLKVLAPIASFYDAMDDFPSFFRGISRAQVLRVERDIVQTVNRLWCTLPELLLRLSSGRVKGELLSNAYDMQVLPGVEMPTIGRTKGDVTIGYVGTISTWFDWTVVTRLAESLPSSRIRVIGPCFTKLPRLPANVSVEPACPREEAVQKIMQFDIGLIPFKKNRLTESVDPIKYYEYRALGKPILSTRFGAMPGHAHAGGVVFFEDASMSECADLALSVRPSLEDVKRFRRENDWGARFQPVADWLLATGSEPDG